LAIVLVAALAAAAYGGYRWLQQVNMYASFDGMETVSIDDDRALIITPDDFEGRAVVVTHGSGADERVTRLDYMEQFTADMLDAGWIVASANAEGEAWGSVPSQDDYVALSEYLSTDRGVDEILVVSFSMGAVSGLNITADERIPNQVGWVGINPVTNLSAAHGDARFTDLIEDALSLGEQAAVDPRRLTSTDFTVPLVVFSGDADTTVPRDVHGRDFAARAGADFESCSGAHLSIDCFQANEILARFG
jgi:pimeloyl-ACP methyl ester carboxylesterase